MDRAVPLVQEIPYRARGLDRVLQKKFASDATHRLCPARVPQFAPKGGALAHGSAVPGTLALSILCTLSTPDRAQRSAKLSAKIRETALRPRATERETVPPNGQRLVRNVDI